MPRCIYCGENAGAHDEHNECVERSIEQDAGVESLLGQAVELLRDARAGLQSDPGFLNELGKVKRVARIDAFLLGLESR